MACECCSKYGSGSEIREYFNEFVHSPQISGIELDTIQAYGNLLEEMLEFCRGKGKTTCVCNDIFDIVLTIDASKVFEEDSVTPEIFVGVMSNTEAKALWKILQKQLEKAEDDVVISRNTLNSTNMSVEVNGWSIRFINMTELDESTIIGTNPVVLYLHHSVNEYLLREGIKYYASVNEKLELTKRFIEQILIRIQTRLGGN